MITVWFVVAFLLGALVAFLIDDLVVHRTRHSGTMRVSKNEEKTIFLLELDDDPETFEAKKSVSFKVVVVPLSPDRE